MDGGNQEDYEPDFFEAVGLHEVTEEEAQRSFERLTPFLNTYVIGVLTSRLSEEDRSLFDRLPDGEAGLQFLAKRCDLPQAFANLQAELAGRILDSGERFGSLTELEGAIKSLLPAELSAISLRAAGERAEGLKRAVREMPIPEQDQEKLYRYLEGRTMRLASERLSEMLPPEVSGEIDRQMSQSPQDLYPLHLWRYGVDFGELMGGQIDFMGEMLRLVRGGERALP